MAASYFWITSVLIATLALNQHSCETVSVQNREAPPQKMVEIIELMLSHRPNDSEKNGFGIQKVSQDGAPNYEILITPNKNLEELKGSQKIKIFVDATNFRDDKTLQESKTRGGEAEKREKPAVFDVLPLSIETVGLNIEQYQQSGIPVMKLKTDTESEEVHQKDFESYPSKRQTNWVQNQKPRVTIVADTTRQADIVEVPIYKEPSYVDQNNPYQPVTSPKKDDRPRNSGYSADYASSNQNVKWMSQTTYVDDYATPVEEPVRTPSRPIQKRPYEESQYEEVRPSNNRRPSREPEEPRRPKPTYTREEDEYISSGGRNPGISSNERRPTYVEESKPTYTREPVEYETSRPSNSRNPVYSREPEEVRPSNSRDEYLEEEVQPARRPSYEPESSGYNNRPQDGSRPVRENSSSKYSGFPESHEPFINHQYLKPLQLESPRVFPASPCLNVFKYEGREPEEDRWYGDIYVSTNEELSGVRLDITLDRPAEILTNWLAETKTTDSTHFTILSLTHKLRPGPPETVKIMVKFNDKKPVPYVKSISLNGRVICPSNRVQKTTTRRPVYENPGDLQVRRTTPQYQEGPKRPVNSGDSTVKRTTPIYEENRKTTVRPPPKYPRPNPNGYEETDQNSFAAPTKKPHSSGRPSHSNGNPPAHAAKPSHAGKPSNNQNHGHSQGSNKPPSPTSSLSAQPNVEKLQKEITCGIPSVQPRPLITNGQLTSRGQWPWHVALYKNIGTDLSFFCGGSLINKNYVLTAAHCVTKAYTNIPLDENLIVVYLGKYHLKLWSEGGVQNRQVSKIHVHPKYNGTSFKSDIAVIALSSPVEYSDYIRPICMWDRSNTNIEVVEGKEGTVVGWGYDENKQLSEELRKAKMPVVTHQECLWSYTDFYPQFTSNLTYCAGYRNGTSVCNGDSGGGMVFPFKDRNGVERWYIRGIVSLSPSSENRVCDPTHFAVFTDVAKFLPWLDNFL